MRARPQLEANAPPPGWTPELDRREEMSELTWMHLASRMSLTRPPPRRARTASTSFTQ